MELGHLLNCSSRTLDVRMALVLNGFSCVPLFVFLTFLILLLLLYK